MPKPEVALRRIRAVLELAFSFASIQHLLSRKQLMFHGHRENASMMNLPFPNDRLKPFKSSLKVTGPKPTQPGPDWKPMSLSDFIQPMLTAVEQGQPWVNDFATDTIMLPVDLHEVIHAYTQIQIKKAG